MKLMHERILKLEKLIKFQKM